MTILSSIMKRSLIKYKNSTLVFFAFIDAPKIGKLPEIGKFKRFLLIQ